MIAPRSSGRPPPTQRSIFVVAGLLSCVTVIVTVREAVPIMVMAAVVIVIVAQRPFGGQAQVRGRAQ